jgi:hypothetical protein
VARKRLQTALLSLRRPPPVSRPFPRTAYSNLRGMSSHSICSPSQNSCTLISEHTSSLILIDQAACTVVLHSAEHARHAPLCTRDRRSPSRHRQGFAPTASQFSVWAACARRSRAHCTVVRRRRRDNRVVSTCADAAGCTDSGTTLAPYTHRRSIHLYLRCSAPRMAAPCDASRSRRGARGSGCAVIQGERRGRGGTKRGMARGRAVRVEGALWRGERRSNRHVWALER